MGKLIASCRRIFSTIALGLVLTACQSAMSLEEARKVTATFSGAPFVPPPRTINDITAILDQQKLADPEVARRMRALADQPPPNTSSTETLADFYHQRGLAAREIGRARQELDDLSKAAQYAAGGLGSAVVNILRELAVAEAYHGSLSRSIEILRRAMDKAPPHRTGTLITLNGLLAQFAALGGDLMEAEKAVSEAEGFLASAMYGGLSGQRTVDWVPPDWVALWKASFAFAQASVLELKGQFREAEALYRQAAEVLEKDSVHSKTTRPNRQRGRIALVLLRQGRLLEAENEARTALLGDLGKVGRYSTETANRLAILARVILEQGRYSEAETLARAAVDIYHKTGAPPNSYHLAATREAMASALVGQRRWREALTEYEAIETGLDDEFERYRKRSGAYLGSDADFALTLLNTDRGTQALQLLDGTFQELARLLGERHTNTAEIRGLRAMAYAEMGDRARALKEFAEATQVLLNRSLEVEDEGTSQPAREQRLNVILAAYMGLLADIKGTPIARQAGIDVAVESFRLADVVRGRSVQRALDASAARAAAKTPALADLVRREQDTKKQISALYGLLANALSQPTDQHNQKVRANLQSQIEALGRARQALAAQIEKEFPAYAELINPKPINVGQVQAILKPGEALITTYVARDRTFVWAIPHAGTVAFVAAPLGAKAMEEIIARLRKALDPSAKTLGDIPEFDLALAHRLYSALLEPVKFAWQQAESLLVVAHGALGQLPLALLPTKPATLPRESGAIFANYREVPWLVRTHAVTMLPSVSALATLRAVPAGDPSRRPFVGFGDPYFTHKHAARAAAREGQPGEVAAVATRGMPITLRSSPKTQTLDSSQLALLPRLPDTAEEIRSLALTMNADLTRDVFLGANANEKIVKTLDLSGYRVLAFATHGLVPGDLDGLTQPALALSAPDVAGVEGDGLLTMEEILGLRLNADWVVLSACNTASGQGAGSEAVSGLGRAFFYAGARALLVSNWPVETTSARALTTDLFQRQKAHPDFGRAQALQQTMNWLIDQGVFIDPTSGRAVFSYAHPIFWASFTLIGDGGGGSGR